MFCLRNQQCKQIQCEFVISIALPINMVQLLRNRFIPWTLNFVCRAIHKFKIPTKYLKCPFSFLNWKSTNSNVHKHAHYLQTIKCRPTNLNDFTVFSELHHVKPTRTKSQCHNKEISNSYFSSWLTSKSIIFLQRAAPSVSRADSVARLSRARGSWSSTSGSTRGRNRSSVTCVGKPSARRAAWSHTWSSISGPTLLLNDGFMCLWHFIELFCLRNFLWYFLLNYLYRDRCRKMMHLTLNIEHWN